MKQKKIDAKYKSENTYFKSKLLTTFTVGSAAIIDVEAQRKMKRIGIKKLIIHRRFGSLIEFITVLNISNDDFFTFLNVSERNYNSVYTPFPVRFKKEGRIFKKNTKSNCNSSNSN